jgi:hypothetical protein
MTYERTHERTYEQAGRPVAIAGVVLTPIEQISIRHHRVAGQVFFTGSKRPVAVLVKSGDRELRIDVPQGGDPTV